MNLDDQAPGVADFRPGQQAAAASQRRSLHSPPLGLTKDEIRHPRPRSQPRRFGRQTCQRLPLLAPRATERPVNRDSASSQVEQAEDALHALGFPQVRVRHHGDLARIEIAREDLPARPLTRHPRHASQPRCKPFGFLYITLDTQGYRTGSMNETLHTILPAQS